MSDTPEDRPWRELRAERQPEDEHAARARNAADRTPSLRVDMDVGFPEDPARALASVQVYVSGARPPVRLYFHVDGKLLAVQSGTGLVYELPAGRVPPGPHTLTVRASDVLGRWADTSLRLELPLSETTLATLEREASTPGQESRKPWRVLSMVPRIWR
jgi:hypothetical protein